MASKPFTVDLNKPLVFQVGHLGEAYNEWVHQPIISKEGPRFFGNDFLEMLTRTVWWINGKFKDADDITTYFRANTLHYLLHGCHHKHPMDGLRLVFPPAATTILSVPLWIVIRLTSTPAVAPALFGGGLLGYVMYDVTHYYLHHGKPSPGLSQNLKRYHLNHHFRDQSEGFGITSPLWDRAFGTYPTTKSTQKNK
uniref:Fatty acid hydroxylase domain-containing protein n=1 Tax=Cucumis melo TaxID=3656 RepID=A0A9I9CQK0_CUCME